MAIVAFWQPVLSLIWKCRIVMFITGPVRCLLAYFHTVITRANESQDVLKPPVTDATKFTHLATSNEEHWARSKPLYNT